MQQADGGNKIMALAEKIAKIQLDQEQTKQKFMNEVFSGLQQIDANKTAEEVEAQRKYDLKTTTATDITTTKTDLGSSKVSSNIRGEAIKTETTIDQTTPKTTTPKFEEIKSGNKIVTYQDGKRIAEAPRWKPEQIEGIGTLNKNRIAKIDVLDKEIRDLETDVAGYRQEVASMSEIQMEGGSTVKGVMRKGNKLTTEKDLLKDINVAQGKIRKKREQSEEIAGKVEKKIAKKEKTIVRTGTSNGRKVIEYSDGSIEYAD